MSRNPGGQGPAVQALSVVGASLEVAELRVGTGDPWAPQGGGCAARLALAVAKRERVHALVEARAATVR